LQNMGFKNLMFCPRYMHPLPGNNVPKTFEKTDADRNPCIILVLKIVLLA